MSNFTIKKATINDLSALTIIYNQAIQSGQTADTVPYSITTRKPWFDAHQNLQNPLFVAIEKGEVLGYATLSKYREGRPALRYVVEISYYIHNTHQRKGLGTALLKYSMKAAKELGYKHAIAILLDANLASVHLLEKFGFEKWGHLPNIAEINGKIYGQYYYGCCLV